MREEFILCHSAVALRVLRTIKWNKFSLQPTECMFRTIFLCNASATR